MSKLVTSLLNFVPILAVGVCVAQIHVLSKRLERAEADIKNQAMVTRAMAGDLVLRGALRSSEFDNPRWSDSPFNVMSKAQFEESRQHDPSRD